VIELPLRDGIDLSGWDIRKALKLFRKSNPPLLEWLQCPIVYVERFSFASRLRVLLPAFYSPRASFFHYLHMAQGNIREYLRGEIVWRKKYFYVLRPLLAMRWIERGLGPVPSWIVAPVWKRSVSLSRPKWRIWRQFRRPGLAPQLL
jgi:predicted nucleotidyltransferase